MNPMVRMELELLFENMPELKPLEQSICQAFTLLKTCYENGGKVLVCGNGGSAADSEHIVGELMKGFKLKRPLRGQEREQLGRCFPEEELAEHLQGALPAISLVSQSGISTAFSNDVTPDMVFAQQVYGYGRRGDVLIGLSTSGNSANVVKAVMVAQAFGLSTISFTGQAPSQLSKMGGCCIAVPSKETYRVQEYHLPIYHALCAMVEREFFDC